MKALPSVAWVHRCSIHASTNYEPLHLLIGRKPKLPAECKELPDNIKLIPDLEESQVKDILEELENTNLQILLNMRDDIFEDASLNIKKAQKRQKRNYDLRHSGKNKTELALGDMVVKEKQMNITRKGGRLDTKREPKYYAIERFLSNGCVILWDLEMDMIDPVPLPASHIKKIVPEYESDSDYEDDNNTTQHAPKRKRNTNVNTNDMTNTTAMNECTMNVHTDDNTNDECESQKPSGSNTVTSTKNSTHVNMNATANMKANNQLTVIDKQSEDEGYNLNVIFTSDEEDNIFDDIIEDDTMAYCDSNNELQIVGETTTTFTFNPLTWSSREEVGPLVQITKFKDIPFQ